MKKVMVVTGASKGIGLATTIAGLQNDYHRLQQLHEMLLN